MDQNRGIVAQLVSTIDTDHVQSKNQDKEGFPDDQKPLTLLNLNEVDTSSKDAQEEWSLLCAGGVHQPDP